MNLSLKIIKTRGSDKYHGVRRGMNLASKERLLRTLRGEKTDRVPISLYEFDGFYKEWIWDEKEYVEVLRYAEGKTDKMYFWAPEADPNTVLFYGKMKSGKMRTTTWTEAQLALHSLAARCRLLL